MISTLLITIILFITIKIIEKDNDHIDFTTVLMIAVVPLIIVGIINFGISMFELNEMFSLIGLALSLGVVFYMSKDAFEWKWTKALLLTSVYLVSSIVVQLGMVALLA